MVSLVLMTVNSSPSAGTWSKPPSDGSARRVMRGRNPHQLAIRGTDPLRSELAVANVISVPAPTGPVETPSRWLPNPHGREGTTECAVEAGLRREQGRFSPRRCHVATARAGALRRPAFARARLRRGGVHAAQHGSHHRLDGGPRRGGPVDAPGRGRPRRAVRGTDRASAPRRCGADEVRGGQAPRAHVAAALGGERARSSIGRGAGSRSASDQGDRSPLQRACVEGDAGRRRPGTALTRGELRVCRSGAGEYRSEPRASPYPDRGLAPGTRGPGECLDALACGGSVRRRDAVHRCDRVPLPLGREAGRAPRERRSGAAISTTASLSVPETTSASSQRS